MAEENFGGDDAEFWHIVAHVHGKEIVVSVGDATQRVKWYVEYKHRVSDARCVLKIILFYFILFYFILFYFILFYFI